VQRAEQACECMHAVGQHKSCGRWYRGICQEFQRSGNILVLSIDSEGLLSWWVSCSHCHNLSEQHLVKTVRGLELK
jgi:hypothetical protein